MCLSSHSSGFRPPEVYCPASALPLGHPSFPRSQAVRHCAWVLWLSWVVLFTLCLLFPPFVMTLISFTCILFACLVYLNWYVSLIVCQFLVLPCVPSFRPLSFILFLYHCFLNLALPCVFVLFCFVLEIFLNCTKSAFGDCILGPPLPQVLYTSVTRLWN